MRKRRETIPYESYSDEGQKRMKRPKLIEESGKGKQGKISMQNKLVDGL